MRSDARNLAALDAAVRQHDASCGFPAKVILMNPFEVERLGWDEFQGIPIRSDDKMPTGRVRIVCDGDANDKAGEETDAVSDSETRELVAA